MFLSVECWFVWDLGIFGLQRLWGQRLVSIFFMAVKLRALTQQNFGVDCSVGVSGGVLT